jgi:hypothetical protein
MRIHLAATTALLLLLTACSTPTVEVPSATVKEAPVFPVTDPVPTTELTTPPTTIAPTTAVTTTAASSTVRPNIPASRVEQSNAFVPKTDDEIAIAYIVSEFQRRSLSQSVNRTYDSTALEDIETGKALESSRLRFEQRKRDGIYSKWGTVQQSVPYLVSVNGPTAVAVVCERNDVAVWDSKGTETEIDDVLLDGSLGTFRLTYKLIKRGEKWLISESKGETEFGACQSVF